MCQTFWRAVVSSTQPPVVHGEKVGDGATEAAEGDAVFAELHHQWGNLGGSRDILGDILVRDGRTEAQHQILSLFSLDGSGGIWLNDWTTPCLGLRLTAQWS